MTRAEVTAALSGPEDPVNENLLRGLDPSHSAALDVLVAKGLRSRNPEVQLHAVVGLGQLSSCGDAAVPELVSFGQSVAERQQLPTVLQSLLRIGTVPAVSGAARLLSTRGDALGDPPQVIRLFPCNPLHGGLVLRILEESERTGHTVPGEFRTFFGSALTEFVQAHAGEISTTPVSLTHRGRIYSLASATADWTLPRGGHTFSQLTFGSGSGSNSVGVRFHKTSTGHIHCIIERDWMTLSLSLV